MNLKVNYILICDGHINFAAVPSFGVMAQSNARILPRRDAPEGERSAGRVIGRTKPGRHALIASAETLDKKRWSLGPHQQSSTYLELRITTQLYVDKLILCLTN